MNTTIDRLNQALAHRDSGPFFMEIPHDSVGPLQFTFHNQSEMERVLSNQVQRATKDYIQATFHIVEEKKSQGDYRMATQLVSAFIRRHPLCDMVHLLRARLEEEQGNIEAAAWSARQAIALQPTYRPIAMLGRILGRQSELEDALCVYAYLYDARAEAPTKESAINTVKDLLVTLGRLHRGQEMVQVADAAIADYGHVSTFHYQAILGLIITQQLPEASRRLGDIEGRLSSQDPLLPKFAQMRTIIQAKLLAAASKN